MVDGGKNDEVVAASMVGSHGGFLGFLAKRAHQLRTTTQNTYILATHELKCTHKPPSEWMLTGAVEKSHTIGGGGRG